MKIPQQLTILVAITALACGNASATPQIASSASISNVTYELIDLNPNDSIAPKITFSSSSSVYAGVAPVSGNGLTSYTTDFSYDNTPHISATNSALAAQTSASINGSQLSASGSTGIAGEYYGSAQQNTLFTLSANTELIVIGHANAGISGNPALPDTVSANMSFQIIDSQHANPFNQIAYYSNGVYSYGNTPANVDENFTLNFFNSTATAMNGTIDINAGVYGVQSPVPEPQEYGMLFAGLALLGAIARRKRK